MLKPIIAAFGALLLCLAGPALAAETATLLKDDTLRSKPFLDAARIAPLKRGSSVQIVKRQGAWTSVKGGAVSGWVRSLSLKSGTATVKAGGLASINTGRLGSGKIVSTTGIRGLNEGSEEELKKAEFNGEALLAAEKQGVSSEDAAAFAKRGKLKQRSIQWLEGQ